MNGERYSRRGFLILGGAGAAASALLYWTRQSMQAHRATPGAADATVASWVDRDGWMLAPSDTLRIRADRDDGSGR